MTTPKKEPVRLYHFTCDHGAAGIEGSGLVRPLGQLAPNARFILGPEWEWRADVAWLTDQAEPDRLALGLTYGTHILCDRMTHRFEVRLTESVRWYLEYLREHRLPSMRALCYEPGSRPAQWWEASEPVPVILG